MVRRTVDPNTLTDVVWTKRSHGSYRNGKPRVQITMPKYIFDAIRDEAKAQMKSVNNVTVTWLEAAYALAHEDSE